MSIVSPIVNVVEINIPRKEAPKKRGNSILGCKETVGGASFFSSWPFENIGMQTRFELMPRQILANQGPENR